MAWMTCVFATAQGAAEITWLATWWRSGPGIRGSNLQGVLVTVTWHLKGKLSSLLSIMFDTNVQNLLAPSYADPDLAVITHLSGTDLELWSLTHPSVVWKLSKLYKHLSHWRHTSLSHPSSVLWELPCPTTRSSSFPTLSPGGWCQLFSFFFFHSKDPITITHPHKL